MTMMKVVKMIISCGTSYNYISLRDRLMGMAPEDTQNN